MKTVLISCLLLVLMGGLPVHAQGSNPLANTIWALKVDDPRIGLNTTLIFSAKDTCKLTSSRQGRRSAQTMLYSISGEAPEGFQGYLLTLTSVTGTGPCVGQTVGRYALIYGDNGNELEFTIVSDECNGRQSWLTPDGLVADGKFTGTFKRR